MNLLDYCLEKYLTGNRPNRNGIDGTRENVERMLGVVYSTLKKGIQGDTSTYPKLENLLQLDLSAGGGFKAQYLPDLLALVFDVVTDNNHNPELWFQSVGGIDDEISATISKLLYGPMGHVTNSGIGSAHGKTYESVRANLMHDIDTNPFAG
ncbi:hypothetical protein [Rahnella sp. AN3-3W3]|uniref:hypothetical protein n=1 Tax=Rahnella sp. AN3-3W3 TaxID=1610578 RepID=UPI000DD30718|nr:hypothetical protein [Rahnella sp. AN3-3W3]